MKIIKHGEPKKEIMKFVCENCGCEFEAEYGEYEVLYDHIAFSDYSAMYRCGCPECKHMAFTETFPHCK